MNDLLVKIEDLYENTPDYVSMVFYGPKYVNGQKTDDLAIVFAVDEKKPAEDVPEGELLPKTIEHAGVVYKTDVQALDMRLEAVSNCFQREDASSNAYRAKTRPMRAGISISDLDSSGASAGTLGGLFLDNEDQTIVGLTCAHVVLDDQTPGDQKVFNTSVYANNTANMTVSQPGTLDGPVAPVGVVKRYVPISKTGTNYIDVAVVAITDPGSIQANISNKPLEGDFNLPLATTAEINSLLSSPAPVLEKYGRTTGSVGGAACPIYCVGLYASANVSGYYTESGSTYTAFFSDAIFYQYAAFAPNGKRYGNVNYPGDSGCLLVANFNGVKKIVGINYAGGTTSNGNSYDLGVACRIDRVAEALNVSYWDGGSGKLNNLSKWNETTTSGLSSALTINVNGKKYWQTGTRANSEVSSEKFIWQVCSNGPPFQIRGLAFGNGIFVAVGEGGGCAVTTNGDDWRVGSMPFSYETNSPSVTWVAVTYGQGKFVALSMALDVVGGMAAISEDGLNWTRVDLPGSYNSLYWTAVAYGNGRFIATGRQKLVTSTDGVNWTLLNQDGSSTSTLSFCNGYFIFGSPGSGTISYSVDGTSWTSVNTGISGIMSTAYGSGRYVCISRFPFGVSNPAGTYAVSVAYSSNLASWTTTTANVGTMPFQTYQLCFGDGSFLAVGGGVTGTASADGGLTWAAASPPCCNYRTVAYGNGIFLACGSQKAKCVASSYKLDTVWTNFEPAGSDISVSGAFANTKQMRFNNSEVAQLRIGNSTLYTKSPDTNYANFNNASIWNQQTGNVTTVGSNGGPSHYGTFDQNGNVDEWIDALYANGSHSFIAKGGNWSSASIPGPGDHALVSAPARPNPSRPYVPTSNSNSCYVWGSNASAQLGDGSVVDGTSPVVINSDTNWTFVASRNYYTLALKSGALYAWGQNTSGQLGDGTTVSKNVPTQIGTDTDWTHVSAGVSHSLGVRSGRLYAWGLNTNGRLGDGTTTQRTAPVQIGTDADWTVVSAGGSHSLGIKGGKLYAWGLNTNGQLGDGTTTERTTPVQIGTDTDWTHVSAGNSHSLAIRSGRLYAWGSNTLGQVGDGTTTQRTAPVQIGTDTDWTAIGSGIAHNVGIKGGKLYAWGNNQNGQLGDGTTTQRTSPIQVGTDSDWTLALAASNNTLAIRNSTMFSWGGANFTKNLSCTSVAIGSDHCAAISGGRLYTWSGANKAWGTYNTYFQLGIGELLQRTSPYKIDNDNTWTRVFAGATYSAGIKNGALYFWGDSNSTSEPNVTVPSAITEVTNEFTAVEGMNSASSLLAIRLKSLYSWNRSFLSRAVSDNVYDLEKVNGGANHYLAIRQGRLYAAGTNTNGQVGNGTTVNASSLVQIGTENDWAEVSAGTSHSLGIRAGRLYAWGLNTNGQLGDGTTTQRTAPVQIGTDTDWTHVGAGGSHSLGVRGGKLYAWGLNTNGQLGDGTTTQRTAPVQIGAAEDWVAISAGANHSVGIRGLPDSIPTTPTETEEVLAQAGSATIGFRVASGTNPHGFGDFVSVADENNVPDENNLGAVAYAYKIMKYEVTNDQYAEFLNAVAFSDANGLFKAALNADARYGIVRTGASGSYAYAAKPNMGSKPVNFIGWYDAARFCNWLHNNKPNGEQNASTTESGAYTLIGDFGYPTRNNNAKYFLPSLNEWYKAAYYKGGGLSAGYWDYATQSEDIKSSSADTMGNGVFLGM